MKSATITIVILLGYLSHCIHLDNCASDKISLCSTYNLCKCLPSKAYEGFGCMLICRNLSDPVNELFNLGKNDINIDIHSERLTFVEVEVTFSALSEINWTNTKNFETVKRLNLSYNELSIVAPNSFQNLIDLQFLDLSYNHLSDIPERLLTNLTKLEYLNLSGNQIQNVSANCLKDLVELLTFNISSNFLTEVPEMLFYNTHKLKVLSLAHNNLYSLPDGIFHSLTQLEVLDLSYNRLVSLQPALFEPLTSLRNLSISYNHITSLEKEAFDRIKETLLDISLVGNPINCGISNYWLYRWLANNTEIFDTSSELRCIALNESKNRTYGSDYEISRMMLSIEECSTCKICDCIVRYDWLIVVVNCTNKNLTDVPQKLPYRARKVILDDNRIKALVIKDENVHSWIGVSFLGLNNNLISSLQTLEELSLVKRILVLNISGNRLQDIPLHLLEQFSASVTELRLANNPWLCNCNTIRFQIWLQDHYRLIKDIENIRCGTGDMSTSNQVIYGMKKSELCPQPPKPLDYLDILNITMGVLILLIVSKVTYDYWHQKKTGKLPKFFGFNLP